MRIAYLDCFAGISGDMFLGALLDAGVPAEALHEAAAALHLGATLKIEKVDRSGITSTKVHVLENGHLAEDAPRSATHTQMRQPGSSEDSGQQHQQASARHQHMPMTQHLHKTGHAHAHDHNIGDEHAAHEHSHGRSLSVIRELIQNTSLAEPVKNFAVHAFELLGAAESRIHNVPVDTIHFHEVGAVDAIVDIVAASAGIHALHMQAISETGEPLRWHASPINLGGGMVECAHGTFPVPAPATADLLRGLPTYSAHLQKELVTPTGAALIRALAPAFGPQPAMSVRQIGYGAGTRNPEGFPNVLRLSLGESLDVPAFTPSESLGHRSHALGSPASFGEGTHGHAPHTDNVTVLETALDDLSPQILAHVTEQALTLGAFDVMTSAVGMKKGRPGTLITILTDEEHSPALERLLLRETSTLGIRVHQQRRICLGRHYTTVSTPYGDIRIKIGSFESEAVNAAPEFEDCRAAALAYEVPVKRVLQAAIAAYVTLNAAAAQKEQTPA